MLCVILLLRFLFWIFKVANVFTKTCNCSETILFSEISWLDSETGPGIQKLFTPLRVGWPPTPQVHFGP